MPRRRDYRAEYARRQEIARGKGFASYYERRIRRGAGPEAERPRGGELRKARGHGGLSPNVSRGLRRAVAGAEAILVPWAQRNPGTGIVYAVGFTVYSPDGDDREYEFRNTDFDSWGDWEDWLSDFADLVDDYDVDVFGAYADAITK